MSDLLEVKRLIEEQGTAWEEFKLTNDKLIKAKADSKATDQHEVQLAAITKTLDDTEARLKSVDDFMLKANRPGATGGENADLAIEAKAFSQITLKRGRGEVSVDQYSEYKAAYMSYLRKQGNIEMLSDTERKSLSAGSDIDGGYFLPNSAQNSIVEKVRNGSVLRQLASQMTISTNSIEGLTDRDDADSGWVGEVAARTATDTPTVGKDRIECAEMYAYPELTQTIIDDAAIDVEAWLTDKVATSFAELENTGFFTGNGVTQPRGLFSYTTNQTADATRSWGVFESVKTGASADFHATSPADYIIDLTTKLKTGYHANAKFLANRAVIAKIRKLKEATTNAYMWQPGMQAGVPPMLFGYPILADENVPALAADSLSLAFGDFKRAFMIVDRIGMRTLRDPYTNKPKVGLYVTKRVGAAARDFDAVKFQKFGT
jgi:HK97 family phage major capsid protein